MYVADYLCDAELNGPGMLSAGIDCHSRSQGDWRFVSCNSTAAVQRISFSPVEPIEEPSTSGTCEDPDQRNEKLPQWSAKGSPQEGGFQEW